MRSTVSARLQWALLTALLVVGCTPQASFESAILAKVSIPAAASSKCVRLVVRPDSGAEASTDPIAAKPELSIAVYRAKDWSAGVTLIARGYSSCDAAADLNALVEQSAEVKANFPGSGTETVQLALIVKALDADKDNHPAGPDDCNDNDATVYRGAPEQCTDTVDKNCSATTGCADLTCQGPCGNNGQGQCVAGVCKSTSEVSCTDGQDNDGDNKVDCADSDCTNVACNDNTACTTGETCNSSGQCAGGTATVCNTPPGACFASVGSCNAADGTCSYTVRTGSCDDQSACTGNDSCQADGGCEGSTAVVCNTPPGQCYEAAGVCNAQDAGCTYAVRTGACDDGNGCTSGETCQTNGSCGAPTNTNSCNSPPGQCFVSAGVCNTADGGCSYAVRTGTCDDGNLCTTGEQCLSDGGCAGGSPVSCTTPPSQCSQPTGVCNATNGACEYALRSGSCNDGNACTSGETCNATGVCTGGMNMVSCNSPPGQCYASVGACIPADAGCTYSVRTGTCDDNNACTTGETCQTNGTCGAPTGNVSCASPPNACFTAAGTCDPANGACSYSLRPGNNNPCDDNNACTTGERCLADGGCANATSTVTCTSPPSQCFASTGTCNPTDATCSYAPRTGSCDDGNPCTTGEQCLVDGGCETGTAVVCSTPPSQCFATTGTCNPANGTCEYAVRTGACNDSSACTAGETCLVDGGCGQPTSVVTCAPPAQCFDAGVCNPATGSCQYPPMVAGTPCNDGDLCNTGDQCNGSGACTAGATPVTCTAANPCFDAGTCSPATGCPVPAPTPGVACSDSDPCTFGEACNASGVCTPTATTTCTANECQTGGSCLADAGCSFNNRPDGFNCNGGNGGCFNGVCVTAVPFGYTPSNFTPNTAKVESYLTIDCPLVFDTSGPTPTFASCYPGIQQVNAEVITQTSGSKEAVVLHVADMLMTDGGSLTVTGTRPLIIAVYGNATINGIIDVSATAATSGAGAGTDCPTATPTSGTQNTGAAASGSGGAGNAAVGGNGGAGDGTATVGQGGAMLVSSNASLQPLAGGCSGANGAGSYVALGGGGGGAVQLSASGSVIIRGRIAASGGGGGGAAATNTGAGASGAGGGSAGGVLVQGQRVTLKATATLTANGGSGGEGSSLTTTGANGVDGPKFTKARATTTDASTRGGNGGQGGGATVLGGATGGAFEDSFGGGGGGGGAAGRIHISATGNVCRETNHVVSPSTGTGSTMGVLSPGFTISAGGTNTTGAMCP